MSTGDPTCSVHGILMCKCWKVRPNANPPTFYEPDAPTPAPQDEAAKPETQAETLTDEAAMDIWLHQGDTVNEAIVGPIKYAYARGRASLETENAALLKRAEAWAAVTLCCGQDSDFNPENVMERRCMVNPDHEWTIPLAHEHMALLKRAEAADELLALHRRYHGKVGCPGEECYVCRAEEA